MSNRGHDPEALAKAFVGQDVPDTREALDGARDILVEELAETADLLGDLRGYLSREARVTAKVVKGKEAKGAKFSDYFDRSERLASMPSHRALALMRAVGEGVIRFDVGPDPEVGTLRCQSMVAARLRPTGNGQGDRWLRNVAEHAWKTKLSTTMETDLLASLRARAHEEAISVFARNLKDLLLAAPAGARSTLGLDPGIRTGEGRGDRCHRQGPGDGHALPVPAPDGPAWCAGEDPRSDPAARHRAHRRRERNGVA